MGCTCSSKKNIQKEKFEDLPQINVNKVTKSKRVIKNEKQKIDVRDKTNTTQKSPQSIKKQFLQPDDECSDQLNQSLQKDKHSIHPQTLPQLQQIHLQINDQKPQSETFNEKPQLESKKSRRQPRISKDLNPDEYFSKIASKLYGKNRQEIIYKTIQQRY